MNNNRKKIRRITKAFCDIDGAYDMISKKTGVKENMLWLLYALDDGEFHSQKQICQDWLFPKTTINTLIKECEAAGYITLQTIPGKKRELQICLTEHGKAYTQKVLHFVYQAEEDALKKTMQNCSETFIADIETYAKNLAYAFSSSSQIRKDA